MDGGIEQDPAYGTARAYEELSSMCVWNGFTYDPSRFLYTALTGQKILVTSRHKN
jgi:hypothetical protein